MDYLDLLESEAIYILREAAAQFQKPVLLFSGGKDSTIIVKLAEKAFRPAKFPFPLLHVDTGHNFPETIESFDFPNAEIQDIVKAISELTGRNFIVDPDVRGSTVTIVAGDGNDRVDIFRQIVFGESAPRIVYGLTATVDQAEATSRRSPVRAAPGSSNQNRAPFGSTPSSPIRPPWASTMPLAIARPRPTPSLRRDD